MSPLERLPGSAGKHLADIWPIESRHASMPSSAQSVAPICEVALGPADGHIDQRP